MADKSEEHKEQELKSLLDDAIRSARNYDVTELSDKRTKAIEYYFGTMDDTPSLPNRSSVVSKDVSTVIGWMLPAIMRVFTASGRMVDIQPKKPEDEDKARQAEDYLNYIMMEQNEGYKNLYNAVHDGLLHGDGILKVWWDDAEESEVTYHTDLSQEQLAMAINQPGIEILTQEAKEDTQETPQGPVDVTTYDVKLKRVDKSGRIRVISVAPEDFLLDKQATTIDESRFCAHREEVTRSDLVEMGFDRDIIDMLPTDGVYNYESEQIVRDEDSIDLTDVADESVQLIELFECYVKVDIDDDGIAETVRAFYAGNNGAGELLDWEVYEDEYPFVSLPCEPVPHRFDSLSISDSTMDLQRIKTVLTRQMLDNVYAHNNPQTEVEQGSVLNPESITSPQFGQPIWRKRGSQPLAYKTTPFVADKALLAIKAMDEEMERRTGVSRQTMALDPDALQNQTATAIQATKSASTSKVELVARNMAELGLKQLFTKMLKLVVKHQKKAEVISLRGNWVEMDPRTWNANMTCTVNVGLGTGSRDDDLKALQATLAIQTNMMKALKEEGLQQQAIEMIPKIIKTSTLIGEAAGLRNSHQHFPTVSPQTMQSVMQQVQKKAQEPTPDEKKLQATMQMEQQKMQMESQLKQADQKMKLEIEQAKITAQTSREEAQMNADIQVHQHEAELKAQYQEKEIAAKVERDKLDHEINLKKVEMDQQELLAKVQMDQDQLELDYAKLSQQRSLEKEKLENSAAIEKVKLEVAKKPKTIMRGPDGRATGIQ